MRASSRAFKRRSLASARYRACPLPSSRPHIALRNADRVRRSAAGIPRLANDPKSKVFIGIDRYDGTALDVPDLACRSRVDIGRIDHCRAIRAARCVALALHEIHVARLAADKERATLPGTTVLIARCLKSIARIPLGAFTISASPAGGERV